MILSTHILPEVQATCDRIIIISDGELVADDSPQALTEQQAGAVVRIVVAPRPSQTLERAPLTALFEGIEGVRSVDSLDGEGGGTFGFSIRTKGMPIHAETSLGLL